MWKKIRKYVYAALVLLLLGFLSLVGYVVYSLGGIKETLAIEKLFNMQGRYFGYGYVQFYKYGQLSSAILDEDREKINFLIDEKGYRPNELGIPVTAKGDLSGLLRLYVIGKEDAKSDFVEYLINKGFNPDECEFGFRSSIYAAAFRGNIGVAEVLLKNGAKVNCPYKDKGLPLSVALMMKQCSFAKYLVTKGASLDSISAKEVRDGFEKKLKDCYK